MTGRSVARRSSWRTIPNIVTGIRLVLIIPILVLLLSGDQPIVVFVVVVVFSATDWVDGLLARRLDQVSRLGEILDPLADRLGISSIGVGLAIVGTVPWWVIIVFVSVDVTVTALTWVHRRHEKLQVSWIGKVRTAVILVGTITLVFALIPGAGWALFPGRVCLYLGAGLHIAAGVGYARQLLKATRDS